VWTKAQIADLRRLAGKMSTRMIGEAIGKSKNAVVGMSGRLGVDLTPHWRGSESAVLGRKSRTTLKEFCAMGDSGGGGMRRKRIKKPLAAKPPEAKLQPPPPEPPPPDPLPLEERCGAPLAVFSLKTHHCSWPVGDPKAEDFHFCSAPRDSAGPPYCAEHRRACGPR
jgi:hypothetical protein